MELIPLMSLIINALSMVDEQVGFEADWIKEHKFLKVTEQQLLELRAETFVRAKEQSELGTAYGEIWTKFRDMDALCKAHYHINKALFWTSLEVEIQLKLKELDMDIQIKEHK